MSIDAVWEGFYAPHFGAPPKRTRGQHDIDIVRLERMYLRVLQELAVNRFKWVGLPDSVNERFLEYTLMRRGLVVMYFDTDYDEYLALQGAGAGPLNMYDEPTTFRVTGNSTFVGKTVDASDCVPIWANVLRVPDWDIILTYAKKLASIDRTIDINLRNARRSRVIVTDETGQLSAQNINNQIDSGSPVITVNNTGYAMMEHWTAFDLGIHPDQIVNLQTSRQRIWNECMGLLGINFANQDKRERLVSAEVGANDEQIDSMKNVILAERQRAVRQMNDKFGLSVDIKLRTELPSITGFTGGEL